MRTRPANLRTGLTLLEVVFAMALLGLLVMSTMAAISYVQTAQAREQRMLAASELANRLILMYIDDPNSPWNEGDTITWSTGEKYRWELIRSNIELTDAVTPSTETNAPSIDLRAGLHLIRARVWLDSESGGTMQFAMTTPHAELARLINPMANLTRPDTMKRMQETYGSEATRFIQSGRINGWRGSDGASRRGDGK